MYASSVLVRSRVCFKALRRGIFGGPKRQECTFNGREPLCVDFKANFFTLYFLGVVFSISDPCGLSLGFSRITPPPQNIPPRRTLEGSPGVVLSSLRGLLSIFSPTCKPASQQASKPASQPGQRAKPASQASKPSRQAKPADELPRNAVNSPTVHPSNFHSVALGVALNPLHRNDPSYKRPSWNRPSYKRAF